MQEYFADPRLAGLYDALNRSRVDVDFYLGLAAELGPRTVVDVGCGTGLLAVELAREGHRSPGSTRRRGCSRSPGPDPTTRW